MGHQIKPVRRVTRKSITDLVKNSTPPHAFQCHLHLPKQLIAFQLLGILLPQIRIQHQKKKIVRHRKLGRLPESAIPRIKAP